MDATRPHPLKGPLDGVEALLFDVFGTCVDYVSSVTKQVEECSAGLLSPDHNVDFNAFTLEWRKGYMNTCRDVAAGGTGPSSVDTMHRQILEDLLSSPHWGTLGAVLDQEARDELNLAWHRLDGWSDASNGLKVLKKRTIVAALSNGNVRLLVDMAKYADLPWDVIFSAEFFGSYKPNPKVYLGATQHLSLPPSKCAMVAAHIYDLRGAAAAGLKTIYVRRATEDNEPKGLREGVRSKAEGGDVDVVVDSFEELGRLFGEWDGVE